MADRFVYAKEGRWFGKRKGQAEGEVDGWASSPVRDCPLSPGLTQTL